MVTHGRLSGNVNNCGRTLSVPAQPDPSLSSVQTTFMLSRHKTNQPKLCITIDLAGRHAIGHIGVTSTVQIALWQEKERIAMEAERAKHEEIAAAQRKKEAVAALMRSVSPQARLLASLSLLHSALACVTLLVLPGP